MRKQHRSQPTLPQRNPIPPNRRVMKIRIILIHRRKRAQLPLHLHRQPLFHLRKPKRFQQNRKRQSKKPKQPNHLQIQQYHLQNRQDALMNGSASLMLKKVIGGQVSFATVAGRCTAIQMNLPLFGTLIRHRFHLQNLSLSMADLAAWMNGSWTSLLMTNGCVVFAANQKNNSHTPKAS